MDTSKLDCVYLIILLVAVSLGAYLTRGVSTPENTYEFIKIIEGDEYVVDFNLTEEDCVSRLAPRIGNYCRKEI